MYGKCTKLRMNVIFSLDSGWGLPYSIFKTICYLIIDYWPVVNSTV